MNNTKKGTGWMVRVALLVGGSREILSTLAKLAIPITIGSSIIAATNILDSAILMDRLQEALGLTEDAARTLKGVYNKTMTLYNLPSSFMVPLTASVIPPER